LCLFRLTSKDARRSCPSQNIPTNISFAGFLLFFPSNCEEGIGGGSVNVVLLLRAFSVNERKRNVRRENSRRIFPARPRGCFDRAGGGGRGNVITTRVEATSAWFRRTRLRYRCVKKPCFRCLFAKKFRFTVRPRRSEKQKQPYRRAGTRVTPSRSPKYTGDLIVACTNVYGTRKK